MADILPYDDSIFQEKRKGRADTGCTESGHHHQIKSSTYIISRGNGVGFGYGGAIGLGASESNASSSSYPYSSGQSSASPARPVNHVNPLESVSNCDSGFGSYSTYRINPTSTTQSHRLSSTSTSLPLQRQSRLSVRIPASILLISFSTYHFQSDSPHYSRISFSSTSISSSSTEPGSGIDSRRTESQLQSQAESSFSSVSLHVHPEQHRVRNSRTRGCSISVSTGVSVGRSNILDRLPNMTHVLYTEPQHEDGSSDGSSLCKSEHTITSDRNRSTTRNHRSGTYESSSAHTMSSVHMPILTFGVDTNTYACTTNGCEPPPPQPRLIAESYTNKNEKDTENKNGTAVLLFLASIIASEGSELGGSSMYLQKVRITLQGEVKLESYPTSLANPDVAKEFLLVSPSNLDPASSTPLSAFSSQSSLYFSSSIHNRNHKFDQDEYVLPANLLALRTLAAQLSLSLLFLHERAGLVHGDVKPANVMVSRDGHVVLGGFGAGAGVGFRGGIRGSMEIGTKMREEEEEGGMGGIAKGNGNFARLVVRPSEADVSSLMLQLTPYYAAPELLSLCHDRKRKRWWCTGLSGDDEGEKEKEGEEQDGLVEKNHKVQYDENVDWWSLGMILHDLAIGKQKEKETELEQGLEMIRRLDPSLHDFIKSLLTPNPHHRLSGRDVLAHPFFDEIANPTGGCGWEELKKGRCRPPCRTPVLGVNFYEPEPLNREEGSVLSQIGVGVGGHTNANVEKNGSMQVGDEYTAETKTRGGRGMAELPIDDVLNYRKRMNVDVSPELGEDEEEEYGTATILQPRSIQTRIRIATQRVAGKEEWEWANGSERPRELGEQDQSDSEETVKDNSDRRNGSNRNNDPTQSTPTTNFDTQLKEEQHDRLHSTPYFPSGRRQGQNGELDKPYNTNDYGSITIIQPRTTTSATVGHLPRVHRDSDVNVPYESKFTSNRGSPGPSSIHIPTSIFRFRTFSDAPAPSSSGFHPGSISDRHTGVSSASLSSSSSFVTKAARSLRRLQGLIGSSSGSLPSSPSSRSRIHHLHPPQANHRRSTTQPSIPIPIPVEEQQQAEQSSRGGDGSRSGHGYGYGHITITQPRSPISQRQRFRTFSDASTPLRIPISYEFSPLPAVSCTSSSSFPSLSSSPGRMDVTIPSSPGFLRKKDLSKDQWDAVGSDANVRIDMNMSESGGKLGAGSDVGSNDTYKYRHEHGRHWKRCSCGGVTSIQDKSYLDFDLDTPASSTPTSFNSSRLGGNGFLAMQQEGYLASGGDSYSYFDRDDKVGDGIRMSGMPAHAQAHLRPCPCLRRSFPKANGGEKEEEEDTRTFNDSGVGLDPGEMELVRAGIIRIGVSRSHSPSNANGKNRKGRPPALNLNSDLDMNRGMTSAVQLHNSYSRSLRDSERAGMEAMNESRVRERTISAARSATTTTSMWTSRRISRVDEREQQQQRNGERNSLGFTFEENLTISLLNSHSRPRPSPPPRIGKEVTVGSSSTTREGRDNGTSFVNNPSSRLSTGTRTPISTSTFTSTSNMTPSSSASPSRFTSLRLKPIATSTSSASVREVTGRSEKWVSALRKAGLGRVLGKTHD